MTEEELAEIDMRYGSPGVPPWDVHKRIDGRGYVVRSHGGNDIIAIKHYSPTIAAAVAEVVGHCHEDVGKLLREIAALRQRVADLTEVARDAHKHLPYGGTRDWVGEVLGIRVADDEDE